jgi:hypothetical protein
MSCKSRLTLEYKDQDIEKFVRENPSWSVDTIREALIKKWGSARDRGMIGIIKKRIIKEIGYKKPKPRYDHWKKEPKDGGFWG